MLILPPDRAETLRATRRLSTREQWMIRGVAIVVAVIAVVVVVASLASSSPSSSRGCIYVTVPAATGTQEIYHCGQVARSICASVEAPGAYTKQSAQTIASACRKAGLPVGD